MYLFLTEGGRKKQANPDTKSLQFWNLCIPSVDTMECITYSIYKRWYKTICGKSLYNRTNMYHCCGFSFEYGVDAL